MFSQQEGIKFRDVHRGKITCKRSASIRDPQQSPLVEGVKIYNKLNKAHLILLMPLLTLVSPTIQLSTANLAADGQQSKPFFDPRRQSSAPGTDMQRPPQQRLHHQFSSMAHLANSMGQEGAEQRELLPIRINADSTTGMVQSQAPTVSLANLIHSVMLEQAQQQQLQNQQSYWTGNPSLRQENRQDNEQFEAQTLGKMFGQADGSVGSLRQFNQFGHYQASSLVGPTTPTLSKQLMAPPFYELGLSPTNAIQIDTEDRPEGSQRTDGARSLSGDVGRGAHEVTTSRSNNRAEQTGQARGAESSARNQEDGNNGEGASGGGGNVGIGSGSNSGSQDDSPAESSTVEKNVEPRQRRRIFNRILKKAEWNHLFVELSKVFLRYFLDLALKDIIGKQGGGGSGSGDTTTSRKKLDAQSELTDLLKDFVKNAISNI